VQTVDEDLGKSGTSTEHRLGFQHLIAEISLAHVGLVVSLDASRLARNNSDWCQLLELCALFGTLLADAESLYDPRQYHDRLLLGLSGMMSEAELHQLKMRLQMGERHKAERGELRQPLPVGLVRDRSGEVLLDPDEEIQARLRLVFQKFKELDTAKAVARYLYQAELPLPSRPLHGPAPHEVIWQPAESSRVLSILKNPAYAGAYVYGRTTHDPVRRRPGHPNSGVVRFPIDKWPILLHNRYPAYITWEDFVANQAQLQANLSRYEEDKHGVPRKGQALLQGIVRCGRCGARMGLHYSGPHGEFPVYLCTYTQRQHGGPRCQEVRALTLDAEMERLVLEALAPDKLALALAALEQLEQEYATLRQQWQLRVERARYEATRARRQYDLVEPENRLVARTLERQWEDKLREAEKTEQAYETWAQQQRLEVTAADRQEILALGENLPRIWHAPTTTTMDRKRLLRLVVKEVLVDQHRERGKVWFQINWQTGATSEHWLTRRVRAYTDYANLEGLQQRLRELTTAQQLDDEIARTLNAEGFRTAHGRPFTSKMIWLLREKWDLPTSKANGPFPLRWEDGSYSVAGAAEAIGVRLAIVYKWLRQGRLHGKQRAPGLPWKISLTEAQLASLRLDAKRVNRSKRRAL
jgi:DNA invertase Pin-like site-specific DNA recombinase